MLVVTKNKMTWRFDTLKYQATCAIAKEACEVSAVIIAYGDTFPDVCEIERRMAELTREPLTAEGLCDSLADESRAGTTEVIVTLTSPLHGPIVCSIEIGTTHD